MQSYNGAFCMYFLLENKTQVLTKTKLIEKFLHRRVVMWWASFAPLVETWFTEF